MSEALWHIDAKRSALQPSPTDAAASGVPVRARYSMISTGTERLVALGQVPEAAADVMAVPYMAGRFSFPIKYGYSLVGHDPGGRAVHCLHPHERIAFVDVADLVVLPESTPLARMALLSNLETALNATWDAEVERGAPAAVCGFGALGALLALTLRLHYDVNPVVVEPNSYRAGLARQLGFEVQADGSHGLLFHTSGHGSGLQWCIDHADMDATIVELSWFGTRPVTLELGARFHFNRVRIISSQVGQVARMRRETVTRTARRKLAADLLSDNAFDALPRVLVPFDDAPDFFQTLRSGTLPDGLVWLIDYGD